jgi:glutaredoxin
MKLPARTVSVGVLVALLLATSAAMQWWHGSSERRAFAQLATLAQPGDLLMLSSVTCPYCEAARHALKRHGVRFDECFIERDAQCKALYDATQQRGTPTLLVRGKPQLGFDVKRVTAALEAPGTPRS